MHACRLRNALFRVLLHIHGELTCRSFTVWHDHCDGPGVFPELQADSGELPLKIIALSRIGPSQGPPELHKPENPVWHETASRTGLICVSCHAISQCWKTCEVLLTCAGVRKSVYLSSRDATMVRTASYVSFFVRRTPSDVCNVATKWSKGYLLRQQLLKIAKRLRMHGTCNAFRS